MHIHAMTDLKEQRHRAIAELIRNQPLANQEELAERLAAQGFAVTQATISRDLEQLGAIKVRRDGRLG
jgi:transcriptional regulator of arginine metabolism